MYDVRPLLDSDPSRSVPPARRTTWAGLPSRPGSYGTTPSRTRCSETSADDHDPTQIVAGRNDELVPWSKHQYLDQLLPDSEIHPLNAGHFGWDQAPEEYGRLVAEWVSGGYRRRIAGPTR
jgi:pimeloyl-ACP methyl ester carboxylesterase